MLVGLRDGQYDLLVEGGAAPAAARATVPRPGGGARADAVTEPRLPAEPAKKRAPSVRPPPVLPAESPRAPAIIARPGPRGGPRPRRRGPPVRRRSLTLGHRRPRAGRGRELLAALPPERPAAAAREPVPRARRGRLQHRDAARVLRQGARVGQATAAPAAGARPALAGAGPLRPGAPRPEAARRRRAPRDHAASAAAASVGKAGLHAARPVAPGTVPPPSAGTRPAAAFGGQQAGRAGARSSARISSARNRSTR